MSQFNAISAKGIGFNNRSAMFYVLAVNGGYDIWRL